MAADEERPEEIDPFAGGYPVPPLPGQRACASRAWHRPAAVGRGTAERGPTDQEATRWLTATRRRRGFLSELFAPVGGFGVTFATMFRKVVTEEYPEVKRPTQPRFHGRHQLNRHPDGLEKCVGCELCAWACPADAIYVEGADNTRGRHRRSRPGERYGRVYQINYLRCIFCGLCIEACPTRALTMTNFYELADNDRGELIFDQGPAAGPAARRACSRRRTRWSTGMEERDYYQGKVGRGRRPSSGPGSSRARPRPDGDGSRRRDRRPGRGRRRPSSARPGRPRPSTEGGRR